MGTYDMSVWKAEAQLTAHNIVFQPGLNEDMSLPGPALLLSLGDLVLKLGYGSGQRFQRLLTVTAQGRTQISLANDSAQTSRNPQTGMVAPGTVD